MKLYDMVILIGTIVGLTTVDMTGDSVRALITGVIAGTYFGWRFLK